MAQIYHNRHIMTHQTLMLSVLCQVTCFTLQCSRLYCTIYFGDFAPLPFGHFGCIIEDTNGTYFTMYMLLLQQQAYTNIQQDKSSSFNFN